MLASSATSAAGVETVTSTLANAIATSVAASNTTSLITTTGAGAENGECKLLGPFALFIQGALGILALGSLVFKRWRERPQRPIKIWAFDASKQVVGSGLLHLANLFMSMLSSGELTPSPKAGDYQANPCSFYLLNLAIDTTLGIAILICLLRVLTSLFRFTSFGEPPESIESGNYGQPPKAKWWLKQCLIYFIGLLCMKLCVFFIFKLCPWIIEIGDWALRWTEGDERIQIFFVMLFFPLVMNALQYYIIDSFIKNKKPGDHELIPSEDGSELGEDEVGVPRRSTSADLNRYRSIDQAADSNLTRSIENTGHPLETKASAVDNTVKKRSDNTKGQAVDSMEEYDPALDGEASSSGSVIGGGHHDSSKKMDQTTKEGGSA